MLICNFCGRKNVAIWHASFGDICQRCEFLLLGNKMGLEVDYNYDTPDGITLWIKDFKVTNVWINNGATSVTFNTIKKYVPDLNPIKVINWIRQELINKNKRTCSMCGKIIHISDIAGSHFAGQYCNKCWEIYKNNNSRRCYICGSPQYECVC